MKVKEAQLWLKQLKPAVLPKDQFSVTFNRSSGPGGQKVNKTSSKATLTLPQWRTKQWLPDEIKRQMEESGFRYATKKGDIVIHDDTQRSRELNAQLCLEKFCSELKKTVIFAGETSEEDKNKWQGVRKRTNERRLQEKQRQSQKRESKKFDL